MAIISSLVANLRLDQRDFQRGLQQAKAAFTGLSSSARGASRSLPEVEVSMEKVARSGRRLTDAQREQHRWVNELTSARARLYTQLQGEDRIAQQVAARYARLGEAQRAALIETRRASAVLQGQQQAAAKLPQAMNRIGQSLTLAVTAPVIALGAAGVKAFGSMEQNLNILQENSNATAVQMQQLSALAQQLGADMSLPATSAADAAKAMVELGRAGLSVDTIMASTRAALQLAAVTGEDAGQAALFSARALKAFRLEGTDLERVIDELAGASKASTASIGDMRDGFQNAASAFALAGRSTTELTTALGIMADAGVTGAMAGTSLRVMLTRLTSPTDKAAGVLKKYGLSAVDARGQVRSLRDIVIDFNRVLSRLTPQGQAQFLQDVFGERAASAARILLTRGVEQWDQMTTAVTKQGAAADAAAAKNKGLKGAIDAMRSAFETALISGIEPIKRDLVALARGAGQLAISFTALPRPVRRGVAQMLALAAITGPLLIGAAKLKMAFDALGITMTVLRTRAALLWASLGGPWAVAAAAAVIGLKTAYDNNFLGIQKIVDGFLVRTKKGFELWGQWIKENVGPALEEAGNNFQQRLNEILQAMERFKKQKVEPSLAQTGGAIGQYGYGMGGGGALEIRQRELQQRQTHEEMIRRGIISDRGIPIVDPLAAGMFMGPGVNDALRRGRLEQAPMPQGAPRPSPGTERYKPPPKKTREPKLTPEERQRLRYLEELAQSQSRLNALMEGGDDITVRLAEQFHLLSRAERAKLAVTLRDIEAQERRRAVTNEIRDAQARLNALMAGGDDIQVRLAESHRKVSAAQRERLAVTLRQIRGEEMERSERQKVLMARETRRPRSDEDVSTRLDVIARELSDGQKRFAQLSREEQASARRIQNFRIEEGAIKKEDQALEAVQSTLRDLNLDWQGLTAQTEVQRFAANNLRIVWGLLDEDGQDLAQQALTMSQNVTKLNRARDAEMAVMERQGQSYDSMREMLGGLQQQYREVTGGAADWYTELQKLVLTADLMDGEVVAMINDILAWGVAVEKATKEQERWRQQQERFADGADRLAEAIAEEHDRTRLLTGAIDEEGLAFERLLKQVDMLDDGMVDAALQLSDALKKNKGLERIRDFVDGTARVLEMALSRMDEGFGKFFENIADGFKRMLLQMAAEFLASEFRRLLLGLIRGNQGGGQPAGGGGGSILGSIAGSFAPIVAGAFTGGGGGGLTTPSLGYQGGGLGNAIAGSFGNLQLQSAAAQGAQRGGAPVNVTMNISTPNAGSFRENQGQIAATAGMAIQRAARRNRGGR